MATQTTHLLDVMSSAFENEGMIARRHTCDGQDLSPPLEWAAGPAGTESYALIMDDPDAPGGTFVHWVAWNIAGTRLNEGIPPRDAMPEGWHQGVNSFKNHSYNGPCPPSGTHRYYFKIYALDRKLDLKSNTTKQDLLDAMEGHVLAEGRIMAKYARQR